MEQRTIKRRDSDKEVKERHGSISSLEREIFPSNTITTRMCCPSLLVGWVLKTFRDHIGYWDNELPMQFILERYW